MDKTNLSIKKHLRLKEPIKLRFKKLKNGNKSLYLDTYWKGHRSYQFLHLYLVPEIDNLAHLQNQEVLKKALLQKYEQTVLLLKEAPCQKEAPPIFLIDYVQQFAEKRKKPDQDLNQGRYGCIVTLRRHLEKYGAKDTLLSQVDVKFCISFIDYLKQATDLRPHIKEPKKLTEGTIFLKYCILRSILIEAVKEKLIAENPYNQLPSSYRLKRPDSSRSYLTPKELHKLIDTPCTYPEIKETFLFSCFTGLRRSDVLNLKWEEILKENGKTYINKKIQKTQRWLKIPLSTQAQQWLPPQPKQTQGIVFSQVSHSALPKDLKQWIKTANIKNKVITFHCARHTFATLELSLGASLYTVSSLLGHKSITTTQVYAKVVNKEKEYAIGLIDKSFK